MAKILVVEDDAGLSQIICDVLNVENHHAEASLDGTDADEKMRVYEYDLIVLDWDLPGVAGIEILKRLRAQGRQTPVLMLTGKDKLHDKEIGLDSGADDYLTKPFELREFTARVRAIIRRASKQTSNNIVCGNLELDVKSHVLYRSGLAVQLRPKELALLEFFMRNRNEVFSSEAILNRVWSSESDATCETLRSWIKHLRAKIDEPGKPSHISTVFGVGYKFED